MSTRFELSTHQWALLCGDDDDGLAFFLAQAPWRFYFFFGVILIDSLIGTGF